MSVGRLGEAEAADDPVARLLLAPAALCTWRGAAWPAAPGPRRPQPVGRFPRPRLLRTPSNATLKFCGKETALIDALS